MMNFPVYDHLRSRIQRATEVMDLKDVGRRSEEQRKASTSMKAEAPLAVLTDIRESQLKLQITLRDVLSPMEEKATRDEIRHRELCEVLRSLKSDGLESNYGH